VSGTGVVAEGVQFSDGSVAMRWLSAHRSTVVWGTLSAAHAVHGHDGKTRFVMLDDRSGRYPSADWARAPVTPAGAGSSSGGVYPVLPSQPAEQQRPGDSSRAA
jgi:hypothetical protein